MGDHLKNAGWALKHGALPFGVWGPEAALPHREEPPRLAPLGLELRGSWKAGSMLSTAPVSWPVSGSGRFLGAFHLDCTTFF